MFHDDFIWLPHIIDKIQVKHGVDPEEVESVFNGHLRTFRGPKGHRRGEDTYYRPWSNRRWTIPIHRLYQEKRWSRPHSICARYDPNRTSSLRKEIITMNKLPQFETLDELVDFWDNHDFTDYMDEMEEVDPAVALPRSKIVRQQVTVAPNIYTKIVSKARQRGLLPETLVNLWLAEKLQLES